MYRMIIKPLKVTSRIFVILSFALLGNEALADNGITIKIYVDGSSIMYDTVIPEPTNQMPAYPKEILNRQTPEEWNKTYHEYGLASIGVTQEEHEAMVKRLNKLFEREDQEYGYIYQSAEKIRVKALGFCGGTYCRNFRSYKFGLEQRENTSYRQTLEIKKLQSAAYPAPTLAELKIIWKKVDQTKAVEGDKYIPHKETKYPELVKMLAELRKNK